MIATTKWWLSNTAGHIHLHTPLFRARVLNDLFALLLSLVTGVHVHARAIASLMPAIAECLAVPGDLSRRTCRIAVVGGGLFPRTALALARVAAPRTRRRRRVVAAQAPQPRPPRLARLNTPQTQLRLDHLLPTATWTWTQLGSRAAIYQLMASVDLADLTLTINSGS